MGILDFDLSKITGNDAFQLGMGILGNNSGHYGAFGPAMSGGMQDYQKQKVLQQALQKQQAQQKWVQQNMPQYANAPAFVQEQVIKQRFAQPKDRKMYKAADGYNYWQDSNERVNPNVVKPPKEPLVTINNKGESKYIEERNKAEAGTFAELQKGADSAYKKNQSLQRFIDNANKGYAGGAAPIKAGVTNFLASFGYDSESLKSTQLMQQAVSDIKAQFMAELGARGLTDKDMEILNAALPRVDSDPNARIEIAQILMKANDSTIRSYIDRVQHENETFPQQRFYRPSWVSTYESPVFEQQAPVQGQWNIRRKD